MLPVKAFATLFVVTAAALVLLFRPSLIVGPLTALAESALAFAGVGIATVAVFAVVLIVTALKKPLLLVKKARLIIGFGLLITAAQGAFAFFEVNLPYFGVTNLGGELGWQIRGTADWFAFARIGVVMMFAVWFLIPTVTKRFVRSTSKGAGVAAQGTAAAYKAAPLHIYAGRALGLGVRGVGKAVKGGSVAAVRTARERRAASKDGSLGDQLGEFFSAPKASTALAAPAGVAEAPDLDEPIRSRASVAVVDEKKPSGKKRGANVAPEQLELPAIAETSPWKLPDLSSLPAGRESGSITDEHRQTATVIEETLAQHGVEVSVVEIKPGPSVTMFGLVPGWNRRARSSGRSRSDDKPEGNTITEARSRVKVDSILAREKDLALALAAPSLRLEAPVPGESVVGVEVPNKSSSIVALRKVMESEPYKEILSRGGLPVALGVASAGEPVALDLLKMPHLLIAGATGSGKSVCMNSIIVSLLAHQPPSRVRLMLVDPKRVELTPYNGVPHLVTPVVVDSDRVVRLLRGAILEMSRRYKLLEEAGVRNIQSYNRSPRATEDMPYFVIMIDELADLMMTASVEVEQAICRLAQLGRATGIHMIVATQRPSVDVVTGLIKANFPSRISFAVASQVDSRTILDMAGAEKLLGRGDMLFLSSDAAKPRRVQGVLITDSEAELLASHWQEHPDFPLREMPLEDLGREAEAMAAERDAGAGVDGDSLYEQALNVARTQRQLSTSMLQRKLGIGYPRAAKLMDQLEDEGIVGTNAAPGKPRDVIYLPDEI